VFTFPVSNIAAVAQVSGEEAVARPG